jgi:hypothetical protein
VTRSVGPALVAACLFSTAALILFGYVSGAAPWSLRLFRTPIPYAILLFCFFVVAPAYLLLHCWVLLRLGRFLALAIGLGAIMFLNRGAAWNWHPAFLTGSGPLWCFGFPLVGALTWWATLKWLAPELDE